MKRVFTHQFCFLVLKNYITTWLQWNYIPYWELQVFSNRRVNICHFATTPQKVIYLLVIKIKSVLRYFWFQCNTFDCNKCLEQYANQTVHAFRYKRKKYNDNQGNLIDGNTACNEHFNAPGDVEFLQDSFFYLSQLLTKQTLNEMLTTLHAWLKTKAPLGFNIASGLQI